MDELSGFLEVLEGRLRARYTADAPIARLDGCGEGVLHLLKVLTATDTTTDTAGKRQRAKELCKFAHHKIHIFPFSDVPLCWRVLYTEAGLLLAIFLAQEGLDLAGVEGGWEDKAVVEALDMVLIMTGGIGVDPDTLEWIHEFMGLLPSAHSPDDRKRKRLRAGPQDHRSNPTNLSMLKGPTPILTRALPAIPLPTLHKFQTHISTASPTPLHIHGIAQHWPALTINPWSDPNYLLSVTNSGKRLVPIELGTAYTDEGWKQDIISFGEYLNEYVIKGSSREKGKGRQRGYLAQHNLFRQIPALRRDIMVPDYCHITPDESEDSDSEPSDPLLNIWLGPANTVSPLHTDPNWNILVQVFGRKYLRLYSPAETPRLFPKTRDTEGLDWSNNSSIPWEMVEGGIEGRNIGGVEGLGSGIAEEDMEMWDTFKGAEFVECVLEPGNGLFIPKGWWHYVRAVDCSCSVSFWWGSRQEIQT